MTYNVHSTYCGPKIWNTSKMYLITSQIILLEYQGEVTLEAVWVAATILFLKVSLYYYYYEVKNSASWQKLFTTFVSPNKWLWLLIATLSNKLSKNMVRIKSQSVQ